MTQTTVSLLVIGALAVGSAYALPPPAAPSFTATYKHTMTSPTDPTVSDTTEISVSKDRSRWERQKDKFVTLHDRGAKTMTAFGGEMPAKKAGRSSLRPTAAWEFGFATIAAESKPPVESGTATIAGHRCTDLQFDSEKFGKPKLCVTDEGIVARFFLDDPEDGSVTTFEAEKITLGEPPASAFTVPDGYEIENMEP